MFLCPPTLAMATWFLNLNMDLMIQAIRGYTGEWDEMEKRLDICSKEFITEFWTKTNNAYL